MKIMTAAFLTDQKELFESACQYVFNHSRINEQIGPKIVETKAWKELEEKDPMLALKMLKEAMFKL